MPPLWLNHVQKLAGQNSKVDPDVRQINAIKVI